MHLSKLLHSPTGKIMLSIILGLGIASLFRSACKGRNCVEYHAPPLDEVKDQTFKFNGKCYTYESSHVKCDTNKEMLEFK